MADAGGTAALAAPAAGGRRGGRSLRAARTWFLGDGPVARLTVTHCVHSAAETFFTVSMAGSIFFSVSADAARPRVLLYLVLTMAPFLVMAPLVGPIVDRVRGGLGAVVVTTFVIRAALAVALAENLRSLLLFPLAFGVLVVAKTYSVGRNALVPALVDDDDDLVSANARLSRSATIAGAFAAALAVPLYALTSATWSLRAAAVLYVVGVLTARRVRAASRPVETTSRDGLVELFRPDVSGAIWDMIALRAAIGFALFHFGFALRADGEPAWLLGAVIAANGVGGFVGTVISPALRRKTTEQTMFTLALASAALAGVAAGLAFNRFTLVGSVVVLGLAVSVGRRAFDSTIQRQASDARRGRVYAGLETRLELAWVGAGCVAVASRVATWVGVLALAGFLVTVTVIHLHRHRVLDILEPAPTVPLAERLVLRAETLADHDHFDEAIVVALSAIEASGHPPPDASLAAELRHMVATAISGDTSDDDLRDGARRAIDLARASSGPRFWHPRNTGAA